MVTPEYFYLSPGRTAVETLTLQNLMRVAANRNLFQPSTHPPKGGNWRRKIFQTRWKH